MSVNTFICVVTNVCFPNSMQLNIVRKYILIICSLAWTVVRSRYVLVQRTSVEASKGSLCNALKSHQHLDAPLFISVIYNWTHIGGWGPTLYWKNVAVIVVEWKKMHPDDCILGEIMKCTGHYRQKLCLEQSSSAVLEKFPCLQHHTFVCIAFTAVTLKI